MHFLFSVVSGCFVKIWCILNSFIHQFSPIVMLVTRARLVFLVSISYDCILKTLRFPFCPIFLFTNCFPIVTLVSRSLLGFPVVDCYFIILHIYSFPFCLILGFYCTFSFVFFFDSYVSVSCTFSFPIVLSISLAFLVFLVVRLLSKYLLHF